MRSCGRRGGWQGAQRGSRARIDPERHRATGPASWCATPGCPRSSACPAGRSPRPYRPCCGPPAFLHQNCPLLGSRFPPAAELRSHWDLAMRSSEWVHEARTGLRHATACREPAKVLVSTAPRARHATSPLPPVSSCTTFWVGSRAKAKSGSPGPSPHALKPTLSAGWRKARHGQCVTPARAFPTDGLARSLSGHPLGARPSLAPLLWDVVREAAPPRPPCSASTSTAPATRIKMQNSAASTAAPCRAGSIGTAVHRQRRLSAEEPPHAPRAGR